MTAAALAAGKAATGTALGNPVLRTEGRVTVVDGILAVAVLAGLALNAGLGWWEADPLAGYVLLFYAAREVRHIVVAGHRPRWAAIMVARRKKWQPARGTGQPRPDHR